MAKPIGLSEAKRYSSKYPEAKPISDLLGKEFVIAKVDFETLGQYETAYAQIEQEWYFTQSGVLRDTLHGIEPALKESPVQVELFEKKSKSGQVYYYFK